MMPNSSTRYLLQAVTWLDRAIWWRKECRQHSGHFNMEHIRLTAAWAKERLQCWKRETFQA